MDKTPLLLALGALLLAGCGLSGDVEYQAGYAARLAGDDDKAFAHYLDAARNDDYPEARFEVAEMYLDTRPAPAVFIPTCIPKMFSLML